MKIAEIIKLMGKISTKIQRQSKENMGRRKFLTKNQDCSAKNGTVGYTHTHTHTHIHANTHTSLVTIMYTQTT